MNRFTIRKLTVSGGGHQDSIIEFTDGLNIIIGPSNTGKSLIMDCIDYVFGFTPKVNRPSKIVDNNNGYTHVELELKTDKGSVSLKREIGTTKVSVISHHSEIESGSYSSDRNAKKNINDIFLKLIGINDKHKVLSSQKGSTQSLTWRSILHLFFIKIITIFIIFIYYCMHFFKFSSNIKQIRGFGRDGNNISIPSYIKMTFNSHTDPE